MYKVKVLFTDLQDNNHKYHVGEEFPRHGLKVSPKRLEELSTNKNKRGIALIEKIGEDEPEEEPFMNPPEEIPEDTPKETPKPKRTKKKG